MENRGKTNQAPNEGATVGQPADVAPGASERHSKPMLTVEQQIAHMKSKGITFGLVSEEEAAAHLRKKCQFFRVYAYRKIFEKRIGGNRDGQYVGLDFGHLRVLSSLDRKLRDALLPMALDLEHFAKVRLLATRRGPRRGRLCRHARLHGIHYRQAEGISGGGSSTGARTIPTRATSCTGTGTTCRSGPSARLSRSAPSSVF